MKKIDYLVIFVIINILILIAFYWAFKVPTMVKVEVVGNMAKGYVNGKLLSTLTINRQGFEKGKVGLHVHGEIFPQAWDWIVVKDFYTGEILFSDGFGLEKSKLDDHYPVPWKRNAINEIYPLLCGRMVDGKAFIVGGYDHWDDYVVEARLSRGLDAGVLVRAKDAKRGILFHVRPKHEDVFWNYIENGQEGAPLSSNLWSTPFLYNVRMIVVRLIPTYWLALVIIVCVVAAYLALYLMYHHLYPLLVKPVHLYEKALEKAKQPRLRKILVSSMAILLFISSFIINLHIASAVLDRIPHVQDSISTLFQAKVFAKGRFYQPSPEPKASFDFEMIVNKNGKWYTKYLPGHSLVMVPGVWLGKPWSMGALFGALSVVLIFLIGIRMYSFKVGFLAGLLTTSSPFFLFMSGSYMAHTSCLLFVALFIYLFVRTYQDGKNVNGILAGLAIGMAAIIRPWTALAMATPAAFYALIDLLKGNRARLKPYFLIVLGAIPPILFLLTFNTVCTGSPLKFGYHVYSDVDRLGFGDVGWFGSHSVRQGMRNVELNFMVLLHHLFGWKPYLTLSYLLIPFVLFTRNRWDWYHLASYICLVLGYYFWWYHGICYGPRFWYEAMPAFTLLSIIGAQRLADVALRVKNRLFSGDAERGRSLSFIVAFAPMVYFIIAFNLADYLPYKARTEYKGYNFTNPAIIEQVKAQGIKNAVVFIKEGMFWSVYGSVFHLNSPDLDTDVVYVQDRGAELNRRVAAKYPGRSYYFYNGAQLKPYSP